MAASATVIETFAADALAALETGHPIALFSSRQPAFTLDDAYRVTATVRRLREACGERPVGQDWLHQPHDLARLWADVGYVYDWTVHDLAAFDGTYSLGKFVTAVNAVAPFGVHAALLLGPWHPVAHDGEWLRALATFEIDPQRDGGVVDHGRSTHVLGGLLTALRYLVELLTHDPVNLPLAAGEIVTTGTLTRVPPVAPG